jgi:hypothetical protein
MFEMELNKDKKTNSAVNVFNLFQQNHQVVSEIEYGTVVIFVFLLEERLDSKSMQVEFRRNYFIQE